jgi:Cu(I)/Ag(I) efflux system membrane protein CusA/SilA
VPLADQAAAVIRSARQVGRAIFFSLAIIVVLSFLPVFLLEAQEGRMFRPLAFTKTFAMARRRCCRSPWCRS